MLTVIVIKLGEEIYGTLIIVKFKQEVRVAPGRADGLAVYNCGLMLFEEF
jgi:hypothetical protein